MKIIIKFKTSYFKTIYNPNNMETKSNGKLQTKILMIRNDKIKLPPHKMGLSQARGRQWTHVQGLGCITK